MDLTKAYVLLLWTASVFVTSSQAASLGGRECYNLSRQKAALVARGTNSHFNKGPEWAKSNLDPEKLAKIKQLISLKETLAFRCDEGEMRKAKQRMESGHYRRWEALKPPLPARNPRFVSSQSLAGANVAPAAQTDIVKAQIPPQSPAKTQGGPK